MSSETMTCTYCNTLVHGKDDVWICDCGAFCSIDSMFRWEKNSAKLHQIKSMRNLKTPPPDNSLDEIRAKIREKPKPKIKSTIEYGSIKHNDISYSSIQEVKECLMENINELFEIDDSGGALVKGYVSDVLKYMKQHKQEISHECEQG